MVFSEEILEAHNSYRKNHGAPAMRWNSQLEANAQSWAQSLAKKGYLQHANQSREGENIACLKGAELTGGKATEMWYAEIKDYDFKNPGFSSKTGHFTQVVWANSIELGVGRAVASNGMEFVVARYYPPGNMLRSFPDNVNVPGSSSVDNPNLNSNRNNNNANPVSTNRNSNRNNNNGNPATTNGSRTTTTDNNQSDTRTNNNYNNNSNNNNNNNNDRGTSSRQCK